MKRKRVGAGQRGSSNVFQSAKDLLDPSMLNTLSNKEKRSGGFFSDCSGEFDMKDANTGMTLSTPLSTEARAPAVGVSLSSPTKGGRALSKKQQKLADAAKSSRDISQYFAKKQTTEKSPDEAEMPCQADRTVARSPAVVSEENISQELHSPAAVEAADSSPAVSQTEDVILIEPKREVIVITDDEMEKMEEEESLNLDHHTSPQMMSITE